MAFTLYNAPQSTCSQRVRFVFNAKQLAFDNIRAQPAFRPTYYPGSLLSERFPHLKETIAASA